MMVDWLSCPYAEDGADQDGSREAACRESAPHRQSAHRDVATGVGRRRGCAAVDDRVDRIRSAAVAATADAHLGRRRPRAAYHRR